MYNAEILTAPGAYIANPSHPSDHTEQDALGSLLWQRAFWIFSA